MKINRFEDLPFWQEVRILSVEVYVAAAKPAFRDFSLRDQMRRSALSALSNVAEGFERGSNKEFIQFLYITKGSLGELRSQVYLAYDNKYATEDEFSNLINRRLKVSQNTNNFINYLKNSKITKMRHKEK